MEKEIMSAQVVFPDGRTLDEVMEEIREKLYPENTETAVSENE